MFLAGGGTPVQEGRVWEAAFSNVATILYWPFALPDERIRAAGDWFAEALRDRDLDAVVTMWTSLEGRCPSDLATFDAIAVGGGTTSKLTSHIHCQGFAEPLAAFIRDGGTYYGGSAGALLPACEITLAGMIEDDPQALGMTGLGVLQDATVLPHADRFDSALPARLAKALDQDVIAVPEDAGIRTDGVHTEAIGPGVVRRVTPSGLLTALAEFPPIVVE